MSEMIRIEGLKKNFGKFTALHDVTFTVKAGEVVGFIGPNGAGKSTTIRTLLGIIKGDGGGDQAKRDQLIKRFELDPKKKAKTYSKGNRQKVGLIAALSVEADLYILDEPTSGLDPLMEAVFQEEIAKIKKEGKAILLSSHILSEVERLADKVVIIRQGKIVETGTLEELRHLTRSAITLTTEGDVTIMEKVKGVHDFSIKDGKAAFYADNESINDILLEATKLGVKKFESVPPTLEDLFMRHYEA